MKQRGRQGQFIIIITSDSCDPYNVGSIYSTEDDAEKALAVHQNTWDERDWYQSEGHILRLSGHILRRSR
jgi:hypothetical protein